MLSRRRSAVPSASRLQAPDRTKTAVVDGVPVRWEQHGQEPGVGLPVIFVHGLPTIPRAWRYVLPLVAGEDVRCLAWEQVGFGGSLPAGFGRDLSIPAQASYLRSWLRHLGIEKALFVTHDYGGGVVQQLVLTNPELFVGLVLTDSAAFDNWPVAAVRTARAMAPFIDHLPSSVARLLFRAALANLGHSDPAVAAESEALFCGLMLRSARPRWRISSGISTRRTRSGSGARCGRLAVRASSSGESATRSDFSRRKASPSGLARSCM